MLATALLFFDVHFLGFACAESCPFLVRSPVRTCVAWVHASPGQPACRGDGVLVMERALRSPLPMGLRPEATRDLHDRVHIGAGTLC